MRKAPTDAMMIATDAARPGGGMRRIDPARDDLAAAATSRAMGAITAPGADPPFPPGLKQSKSWSMPTSKTTSGQKPRAVEEVGDVPEPPTARPVDRVSL